VNGCSSPAGSGTAAPKTIPSAPAVAVVNNCNGTSTLSTTATGSLLWSTGATTSSITVNATGNYTVTTTVNGCASTAGTGTAAPKTTPATPVVTVVNNCGSSVLSTTATGSLLWSTGATTSSITVSAAANYTVTATVNGCSSTAGSGTAAPKALPAAPTATVTQPTCAVTTATITVTSSKTGLTFSTNGSTYTNTTGIFTGVTPGTYNLTAKNAAGCISLPTVIVVTANVNCSSVGDFVFSDLNANGIQDKGEPGIAGVTVKLLNASATVLATATTNTSGNYGFTSLAPGTYSVAFTTPAGYTPTLSNVGSDDTKDSDPVGGTVTGITLTLGQSNQTVDAGFIPPILALGNRVWYDANNDGINNSSENGMRNITVNLYKDTDNNNIADGAAIATKLTDANGYYTFTSLAPGNYIVGAVIPAGYVSSAVNAADPDNNINLDDNGSVLVGNEIRGLAVTLAIGTEPDGTATNTNTNNSYDFGLLPDCGCINASGNLLTNGNFESGTTGWTAVGGTVTTGTGFIACGGKNGFNNASSKASIVYQDVTIAAGTTVTFSGFAGTHTPGLSCTPKLSLIFRNAAGTVLGQTDVAITQDVDVNFGQLAYYTITGTAPVGTAKVRIQSSIGCNYVKMDAFCLRTTSITLSRGTGNNTSSTAATGFTKSLPVNSFDVTVMPNPTTSYFDIATSTGDINTPVEVRITSADGRLLSVQKTAANATLKIGTEKWRSGMYFVEVIQGEKRKVVKLMKL
jgi:hypothetical protein